MQSKLSKFQIGVITTDVVCTDGFVPFITAEELPARKDATATQKANDDDIVGVGIHPHVSEVTLKFGISVRQRSFRSISSRKDAEFCHRHSRISHSA